MSTPDFDKTISDADQFDFLDEEAANTPARQKKVRSSKELVMPIIRKPVPISESGPARVGSLPAIGEVDDDFDFLSSDQQGAKKAEQPTFTEPAWNEGIHDYEAEDKSPIVGKLITLLLGTILIAGAVSAYFLYFKPKQITQALNPSTLETPDNDLSTESSEAVLTANEATSDGTTAKSLSQQFFEQLRELEAMVASGELDAAQQTIASMDRSVYGYGAPEFSEIEQQIERRRSGAPESTSDTETVAQAEQAASVARQAQLAAEQQAAAAEIERVEAMNKAEAERLEAARVAEAERVAQAEIEAQVEREAEAARQAEIERAAQAAIDAEAARLRAAEELRLAQANREAEAARLAEAERVAQAERERAAEAQRAEQAAREAEAAKVAEAARLAEAQRLEQAAQEAQAAKLAEAERLAQTQRLEQAAREAEALKLAEAQRQAEAARAADAAREAELQAQALAEQKRADAAAAAAEADRVAQAAEATLAASQKKAADESLALATAKATQRLERDRLAKLETDRRIAERARLSDERAKAAEFARQQEAARQKAVEAQANLQITPTQDVYSITDNDFNFVGGKFVELKTAIENRDIANVIALTQRSGKRVQQMLQIFENNSAVKARLVNVKSRNAEGIIVGQLKIQKLVKNTGVEVDAPSNLSSITLTSKRGPNGWSTIAW